MSAAAAPLILGGGQAVTSLFGANAANNALRSAAQSNAVQITRAAVDRRQQRIERFIAEREIIAGADLERGGGSENVRREVAAAAGDAGVDLQIIEDELKAGIAQINADLRANYQSPVLAAAKGALAGVSAGAAFNSAFGIGKKKEE